MKYLIVKDIKRRILVARAERYRLLLKALATNQCLSSFQRFEVAVKLRANRFNTPVRIRNRCILTGRARAVSRRVKLTRMKFRELASFGFLFGVRKASW